MVSSTASLGGGSSSSQIRPGSTPLVDPHTTQQPVQIPGYTTTRQISQNTPVINSSIIKPSQPVNFNFKGKFLSF